MSHEEIVPPVEETLENTITKEEVVMSDNKDFEYSIRCGRDQVAEHFETLARFFREGQIKLSTTKDSIILNPTDLVKLELEAKNKPEKNKGELKIEISWKEKDSPEPIEINPVE